jgi:hypothetical protein
MGKFIEYAYYGLAIVFFLLQCVQIIRQGPSRDTLVVVSELLLFLFFLVVYTLRKNLAACMHRVSSRWLRWLILGYAACFVAETVYIFSKPLHRNLIIDLILTAPWYILWMLAWYGILRRYDFSVKEAFILGGLHGFFVEGIVSLFIITKPILALLGLPLFSVIYGFFFITPYLVLRKDFTGQVKVSLRKKILLSLIPLLAYIPGFIWILLVTKGFGLVLH